MPRHVRGPLLSLLGLLCIHAAASQSLAPPLVNDSALLLASNATPLVGGLGRSCSGPPPPATYVVQWRCTSTPDGGTCSGVCAGGTTGSASALCQDGVYVVQNLCLVGGIYGFDDVVADGTPVPQKFLGLAWTGMRVAAAASFGACNGYNGFKTGVVSAPNVAYSVETGAAIKVGNVTYLASSSASLAAPSKSQKISVYGLWLTAAWQDDLNVHVSAWAADGTLLGVRPVKLDFLRPLFVDLRGEPGFTGLNKLTLVGFGGTKVSCNAGTNVVVDDVDVRLHPDASVTA